MLGRRHVLPIFLVIAILIASCAHVPYTERPQFILISETQEIALGTDVYQEILKESQLSRDTAIVEMVRRVGWRIARVSGHPDYKWEFNMIEDDEVANAFALPGGKVAVYTGILKYTQDEEGLATVMSHEIAHAIARHGAERMTSSLVLNMVGGSLTGAAKVGYGIATGVGIVLPFSRKQESEADHIGLILMAKAGYDPRKAIDFWSRMMTSDKKTLPVFLSTHPADEKRIAQIRAWMPEALNYYKP